MAARTKATAPAGPATATAPAAAVASAPAPAVATAPVAPVVAAPVEQTAPAATSAPAAPDADAAPAAPVAPVDGVSVTVIVAENIGGLRNGQKWPAVGEPITLPAAEAADYLKFGYVREDKSAE